MDAIPILPLISRWLHVGSAVLLAGTILFYAVIFAPVARKALDEAAREQLRVPLMKRMKLFLHPPIVLFLLTGFYNYMAVTAPLHEGQALYHALFGVKFLLALVVFALMILLTSTMSWSEKLRDRKGLWGALVLATVAVVLIGGVMKSIPAVDPGEVVVESVVEEA